MSLPPKKATSRYVNHAHAWMDEHVLSGQQPAFYGYLLSVEHTIGAEEIWSLLQFWSERYLSQDGDRARGAHTELDRALSQDLDQDRRAGYPPPYCHKGCANCCYQPVACTDAEAALILAHCAALGIPIDFAKLERQLRHLRFDADDTVADWPTWEEQSVADQRCIFLDPTDQACVIWEVRPLVCRAQLAEQTNKYCRAVHGSPDPRARGIHHPASSFIMSAVFSIHRDTIGRTMNRLLLEQALLLEPVGRRS